MSLYYPVRNVKMLKKIPRKGHNSTFQKEIPKRYITRFPV